VELLLEQGDEYRVGRENLPTSKDFTPKVGAESIADIGENVKDIVVELLDLITKGRALLEPINAKNAYILNKTKRLKKRIEDLEYSGSLQLEDTSRGRYITKRMPNIDGSNLTIVTLFRRNIQSLENNYKSVSTNFLEDVFDNIIKGGLSRHVFRILTRAVRRNMTLVNNEPMTSDFRNEVSRLRDVVMLHHFRSHS